MTFYQTASLSSTIFANAIANSGRVSKRLCPVSTPTLDISPFPSKDNHHHDHLSFTTLSECCLEELVLRFSRDNFLYQEILWERKHHRESFGRRR